MTEPGSDKALMAGERSGFSPAGTRRNRWLVVAVMVVLGVWLVLFMHDQQTTPKAVAPVAEKPHLITVPSAPADVLERKASSPSAGGAIQKSNSAPVVVNAQDDADRTEPQAARRVTPDVLGRNPVQATLLAERATSSAPVFADVIAVEVSGNRGAYEFIVTVMSNDLGCDQYADWWEVLTEDGRLVYRRVLAHSHAGEQPFTRSGGEVRVDAETTVWVRAHMHPHGYGGQAMTGSVRSGFRSAPPNSAHGAALAKAPPLPSRCAF